MIHLISEMTLTVHFSCDDLDCSLCLLILYRKSVHIAERKVKQYLKTLL